jgi:lysophospholipase L1-like esterase
MKHFLLFAPFMAVFSICVNAAERPYVMGALGDSISAGFNAARYGDNRELSWASGLDSQVQVQSHARKLQSVLGERSVEVHNEAFVGAISEQLPRQASRLLRVKPDYVTIAIGANDVCVWNEDYLAQLSDYTRNVDLTIQKIIAANAQVKIILSPVPTLRLMYELGVKRTGCQSKWDTMEVCKPLLASDRTDDDREKFYGRLSHLNKTIEEVAAKYPQNVRFAKSIADTAFDESSISSLDCFHPSVKGHNLISEMSFDPSWY